LFTQIQDQEARTSKRQVVLKRLILRRGRKRRGRADYGDATKKDRGINSGSVGSIWIYDKDGAGGQKGET